MNRVNDRFIFNNNLNINRDYIYTIKLDVLYGWENIINNTDENNKFRYSLDNETTWKCTIILRGVWNFNDINIMWLHLINKLENSIK